MKRVLITGTNSGIGRALAEHFLKKGAYVYGVGKKSRPAIRDERFRYQCIDLKALETIAPKLQRLLNDVEFIDTVVLNAGVLGEIKEMSDTHLYEIEEIMRVNVWANKIVIDTLNELPLRVDQIVGISSGAAVNASRGWGGYSLSKSALNMLLRLYSREMPDTHITALAPGVVDTAMVRHIIEEVDAEKYKSVKRLKDGPIQNPEDAAKRIVDALEKAKEYESGSFLDVRSM